MILQTIALTMFVAVAPPALDGLEAGPCAKLVFGQYCLGGSAASLPEPAHRNGSTLVYGEKGDSLVGVTIERDLVRSVVGFRTPGTWLVWTGLRSRLIDRYGQPTENKSYWPGYADGKPETIAATISLGKGQAVLVWRLPAFAVTLQWHDGQKISIVYTYTADGGPKMADDGL